MIWLFNTNKGDSDDLPRNRSVRDTVWTTNAAPSLTPRRQRQRVLKHQPPRLDARHNQGDSDDLPQAPHRKGRCMDQKSVKAQKMSTRHVGRNMVERRRPCTASLRSMYGQWLQHSGNIARGRKVATRRTGYEPEVQKRPQGQSRAIDRRSPRSEE